MKQQLFWKGDLAEYTGNKKFLHNAWFYEIILLEGHLKGQTKWTQREPVVTNNHHHN